VHGLRRLLSRRTTHCRQGSERHRHILNKAAEALFGNAADEIIGRPITTIIPPERISEEEAILDRERRGERLAHFETMRRCKDGTIIPVSLTISAIRDDEGRIIGVSKIVRDLSEAQLVHQEVKRGEALLCSILDTVPDALVVIDERGLIQSFSAAAEQLVGFTSEDVVGRNVSLLMPSPNRGRMTATWRATSRRASDASSASAASSSASARMAAHSPWNSRSEK
jgi:two-component system sensor kinase FixL